ncbi:DUF473 domain-containing protein [Methanocaldococcus fervens]|uniref:Uncharacterized protein n=1 Tax=Methanocaldococcus fervens (strain DSM 4213 / JCM 15782 / AG86) TaxID=573064 RepID=C7P6K2_METFA|nr:DUF473 family protein [Methanocaldococcus fervens]ACV24184.1 Protein of unknown function DUF473 [Methanocaldococcus fervens AG86]
MKVYGLFGISENAINEFVENHVKTFTLINALNLETVKNLKEGDLVFITSTLREDLRVGSEGILGKVLNVSLVPQRVNGFEEKEIIAGRVQLEMLGFAKCVGIESLHIKVAFRMY